MASPIQQPYEATLPDPVSEWKLSGRKLVRPLRGAELLVRSSEHYCDGNFQLTAKSSIETPLTNAQLRRRHHAAWYRTRLIHPVIGVEFPTLSHASYALHHTAKDVEHWTSQTCIVETNTTINDVYLARSREKTSRISMTLVLDPVRGPRGCVLDMSHTLISVDIFLIMQEFIAQLARPDTEAGIAAVFSPQSESMHAIMPRLPQSLGHAYSHCHTGSLSHRQPSARDLQDALEMYQHAQSRWSRSSIGIPLHPNHTNRPRAIQNKTIAFEPAESKAAFKFLKQAGVSLTAAFFASMTAAIAQRYHYHAPAPAGSVASAPRNEELELEPEGAHLLFSAHGRRWLDTSAANGHGPVTMPIIPSSAWVSAKDVNLRPRSQRGLLKLAAAIEEAQREDLVSPHIIPVFDQLAPELVTALANAHALPNGPPPPPSRGRPTLTSQGQFLNARDRDRARRTMCTGDDADAIDMTDFNTGGRTTDPTVCFALNSFRDELKFNLLFDEKFFDLTEVMLLGYEVAGMFRRLVGVGMEQEQSVRAKL